MCVAASNDVGAGTDGMCQTRPEEWLQGRRLVEARQCFFIVHTHVVGRNAFALVCVRNDEWGMCRFHRVKANNSQHTHKERKCLAMVAVSMCAVGTGALKSRCLLHAFPQKSQHARGQRREWGGGRDEDEKLCHSAVSRWCQWQDVRSSKRAFRRCIECLLGLALLFSTTIRSVTVGKGLFLADFGCISSSRVYRDQPLRIREEHLSESFFIEGTLGCSGWGWLRPSFLHVNFGGIGQNQSINHLRWCVSNLQTCLEGDAEEWLYISPIFVFVPFPFSLPNSG